MRGKVLDDAWTFLDAVYHGFDQEASTIVRELTPDDTNDVLWMFGHLLRGCVLGTEKRLSLEPGAGMRVLRSQFIHPSEGPCG